MIKRLFFLWFGDVIPSYASWTISNYQKINPDWVIIFKHYNTKQILNYKDQNDPYLIKTIEDCFKTYNVDFSYNIISDVYRWKIIDKIYDTYIDLDTYPISKLDNFILCDEFDKSRKPYPKCISYCHDHNCNDQWFISNTNRSYCSILNISKNIVLTSNVIRKDFTYMNENETKKWDDRIQRFLDCDINLNDNFCSEILSPCEHFGIKHRSTKSAIHYKQKNIFDKVLI